MARRSDHNREELYALAIGAARQIVESDGIKALTARNVADVIGYSPGTLYNLFDNLDDLIVHLNGSTLDDLFDKVSALEQSGDPESDCKALLGSYLDYLNDHPGLWYALFDYAIPTTMTVPSWYVRKIERLMEILRVAIAPLYADTQMDETARAASVLWAGLHGITSLSNDGKLQLVSEDDVEDLASFLVTTFIAGIQSRARQ
ncbi:TetR/AcrR family transcriptional regulator [Hwanghaeella grinnelliae]|uniref:TetR/AcrR family transcriptional regulator n=1 Tax=Hwanghaeella grinnelliae TaxID=2500179 RepID=A0A437QUK7_9PROT|nr:TetR/AcrR family transcriptional regulator [Hwanghaeella grinnelliae]RVU38188.1 TetR/AcrR family transcriptional regulator [Hwanghaeella grinnelliae]